MYVKRKAVAKGVIWSLLDTFGNFGVKFFFALAITRILSPRDYGLIAYMGMFLGIASWLAEGGFGNALIQKRNATEVDFSTGYIFNVGVSLFFFLLYFFSAPFVSEYFNEPELKNIMRVSSVNLVINSLCYVHLIKLMKDIQFKQQAVLNFSAAVISGTIGLVMAFLGYGYWALVFQTILGSVIIMTGLWYIVKWKPSLQFNRQSFREQFKFGSKVFLQGLLESVFREINSLVIGKSYQTAALGTYSRGQRFYELFIVQTGSAFNKVLYPAMARETDEKNIHKNMYGRIYSLLFFIMAPLSLFLFLFSDALVRVILTDKWVDAIPIMRLYFLAGFIIVLVNFNSATILSANQPKLFLKMDLVHKILMGISLLITFSVSIQAIIIGWLIVNYFYFIISEWIMYKLTYGERSKYAEMLNVLVCLIPSALCFLMTDYLITDPLLLLMVNIVLQPVIYFVTMKVLGFGIYSEFAGILKPMLPKRMHFILQNRN